jgi:hypothetical protein
MRALLATVALWAAASHASAGLLFYDGFDYSVGGNLNGQTNPSLGAPWLKSGSSPAGTSQTIAASSVSYPGLKGAVGNSVSTPRLAAASNSANRITLPSAPYVRADEGSLFFSFTFRLLEWDAITDTLAKNSTQRKGGLVAGFHGGVADTATGMGSGGAFAGSVWVRRAIDYSQTGTDGTAGTQNNRYEVGILKTILNPTAAELETAFDTSHTFAIGETIFVVAEYKFVNDGTTTSDVARLWLNPTPGGVAGAPSAVAPASMAGITTPINSFYIYSHTNSPGDSLVDEVRVGTTFASVTPVPEPSGAIVALGALGFMAIRGRRAPGARLAHSS